MVVTVKSSDRGYRSIEFYLTGPTTTPGAYAANFVDPPSNRIYRQISVEDNAVSPNNHYYFADFAMLGAFIKHFNGNIALDNDLAEFTGVFIQQERADKVTGFTVGSGTTISGSDYVPELIQREFANGTGQHYLLTPYVDFSGTGYGRNGAEPNLYWDEWTGLAIDQAQFLSAVDALNNGDRSLLSGILEAQTYNFIGGRGRDVFAAGVGNDTLRGNDGDDDLNGGPGRDILSGGNGSNTLRGSIGDDTYIIGDGADVISDIGGNMDTIRFTNATEVNWAANIFTGDAGNDIFHPWEIERFEGSSSGDTMIMHADHSTPAHLIGNAGNDFLTGGAAGDFLDGGSGADTINGGRGNDHLRAGTSSDTIDGGAGTDTLFFTHRGNLSFSTGWTVNLQLGQATTQWRQGGLGIAIVIEKETIRNVEYFSGSQGNDTFVTTGRAGGFYGGGNGVDTIRLNVFDFLAVGQRQVSDTVIIQDDGRGSASHLEVDGLSFKTVTEYFASMEIIDVNDGADRVTGSSAAETIYGGTGSDILNGRGGDDFLVGQADNDIILGGLGNDRLIGGQGMDAFLFNSTLSGTTNVDSILDFRAADDTIRLDNAIFTALTATGVLADAAFEANASGLAQGAEDRIIYNQLTGALFYDANGNAAGGAVQFATLATKPTISAADFVVI